MAAVDYPVLSPPVIPGTVGFDTESARVGATYRHQKSQDLILDYLPLVESIARRVYGGLPPNTRVELHDLAQSGSLGLVSAGKSYDPEAEVPFPVYARFRVEGEILDSLRRHDLAPRKLRRWQKQASIAKQELAAALHREPTEEELCERLQITSEELQSRIDRVNAILTSGNISDGPPAVPGVPLFTYAAGAPTAVAQSLTVSNTITPDQLAAIDPGPPYVSNGIALRLSNLASPTSAADEINGSSYAEFYGSIAASIGGASSDAQGQLSVQQQTLAQARSLRSQSSGVSLDEEAALLIQYQRAYEATAKMVNALDELTVSTINMLPSS